MEPRPSSEFTPGALLLGSLAVASGAILSLSPLIAVAVCPLAFALTDVAAGRALGVQGPSARVRVVARGLASAAWGGSVSTIVASRGAEPASVRLPLLAIALAVGTVLGVYGSAGRRAVGDEPARAPLGEAPLIALCDVLTAAWAFVNAVGAHEGSTKSRVLIALSIAVALTLRALLVLRIAARDPESPGLAGAGFVAWLALASIACTLAATPLTWSGLGAALILTLAAALAESRRRRALVVMLRGSLALAFAAMLGIATFLAT